MSKSVKKNQQNEPITPNKIYETIQAREFLQDLWWDLISDIKEKPTYKRLKSMVIDVVHNNIKDLSVKPIDKTEEVKRQTTLTEISMMTYTVDTIISEVLYQKFENEYKSLVTKIIDETLNENPSSSDQESASVFENIESIFSDDSLTGNSGLEMSKTVIDVKSRKRGRPRKIIEGKTLVREQENTNSSPKRKRGRPRLPADHPGVIGKKKAKSIEYSPNSSKILNKTNKHTNQESDAESEVSDGNFSFASVSSVHTSELSSFEDTISVCSDNGINRERTIIPLKVANDMYVRGKLSQIYSIRKKGEILKLSQVDKNLEHPSRNISITVASESRPQRIRKPNLKYKTEAIYCDVQDNSSSHADSGSSYSSEMKDDFMSSPPRRQRKLKRRDRVPSKNISASKNSTKRYDSSDLYKPHSYNSRTALFFDPM